MESTSACLPLNVFRVKRKRTADPLEALLVSLKHPRFNFTSEPSSPVLYHLTTTSEVPDVATIGKITPGAQFNIIDFDPSYQSHSSPVQSGISALNKESNPLEMLNDAVGEVGSSEEVGESNQIDREITLNGVKLSSVSASEEDYDYVFDFYWNAHGSNYNADQYLVRPAKADEIELYAGEDTESSTGADDDDDSNREDNWRNDYPEDESNTLSSSGWNTSLYDIDSDSLKSIGDRFEDLDFYSSDGDCF